MKKLISFNSVKNILPGLALAAALTAGNAMAYTSCDPCAPITCDPCAAVGCKPKKSSLWEFGGWIEAGIYGNEYEQADRYRPASGFNFMGDSGNTGVMSNVAHTTFQANQVWIYGQKKLSKRGFDVGGRVDFAYGTAMNELQSANLEYSYQPRAVTDMWGTGDYYMALPQLYGEIGINNLSLKVGKFLNPLGYESAMAPERFFYSLDYAYHVHGKTLSGAVFTWDVNKDLSFYGGWVSGENKTFDDEYDNAFLGGVDWQVGKRLKLSYGLLSGVYDATSWEIPWRRMNYTKHSFIADVKFNERWNYVFEWTLYDYYAGTESTRGAYGINNELFFKINKRWTFGVRAEWMHYHNTNVMYENVPEDDALALTLALKWKPTKWFTLTPEVRYDVFDTFEPFNRYTHTNDPYGRPYNEADPKNSQWSFGISGVVKF